jgi:hypothetical protein
MNNRPDSVTIIGSLLITTGTLGLLSHLADFRVPPFHSDIAWVSLIRLVAILSGAYVLCGRNWARWLALAWILFHVVIGALHSSFQFAVHALLCAAFAYFLFRPSAGRYFRRDRA